MQHLKTYEDWKNSQKSFQKTSEQIKQFVGENPAGVSLSVFMEFHLHTSQIPVRKITKMDVVGIFAHQPLTFDGKVFANLLTDIRV